MYHALLLICGLINPAECRLDIHMRCDKVALDELNGLVRKHCKFGKKKSKQCKEIEQDVIDYLTAFHTGNNAFCARIHAKHNLELIPPYKRNPKRVI